MYHPVDKRFLYCAVLIQVELLDEYDKMHVVHGTGFLLSKDKGFLGIVTNRHVVDASYSDQRKLNWNVKNIRIRGFRLDGSLMELGLISPGFIYPANRDEDVALLTTNDFTFGKDTGAGPLVDIDLSILATKEYFGELNPGDFVVFSGFPEWADASSGRPIIRSGILASDPMYDYTGPTQQPGARRVAMEGFSFSGSSGSPVFALACGLKLGGGLTGGAFRDVRLIGVNAGSFLANGLAAKQHAGISYFFKSTVIAELAGQV